MSRVLAWAVLIVGAVITAGWLVCGRDVTCISGTVNMKPATSTMFGLSGAAVLCERGGWMRTGLSKVVLLVSVASMLGLHQLDSPAHTIRHGMPSMVTLLLFIAQAFAEYRATPLVMYVVSGVVLLGHAAQWPLLIGYVPGVSTGMAMCTAVGFILLAAAIQCDVKPRKQGEL